MSKDNLIFTRLLYPKDEVINSIWYSFENKTSYDECLFWCYELYMSGFEDETMEILFTMYFCYNAFHNQKLVNNLDKIFLEWRNEKTSKEKQKYVATFLLTIYNQKYSNVVYNFVQNFITISKIEKITLYKGAKPKWLLDYEECVRNFIRSLSKQNIKNIFHFLKLKQEKPPSELEKIEIAINQYMENCNLQYLYTKNIKNTIIVILTNIFRLLSSYHTEQNENNTRHFQYCNTDNLDLNDYTNTFEEKYQRPYKILRQERKYQTHIHSIEKTNLSIFKQKKTWQQCYYDDWLYYASFSKLWKNRIEQYDGTIDHKNKTVNFDDHEEYKNQNTRYEEFYNHYNLEPDEQPREVFNNYN